MLGQAGMTGAGGLLFWPEWPGLNNPMTFLLNTFAGATGVWFVRTVATPRQYSTLLERLAMGVIFTLMVVSAVDVFVPTAAGFALSMHLLTLSMLLVLLLLLLLLLSVLLCVRFHGSPAPTVILLALFLFLRSQLQRGR